MEIPATRQTRNSQQTPQEPKPENTHNLRNSSLQTRQRDLLSYFSKKKDLTEYCTTPKKKLKIASNAASREATPKKSSLKAETQETEENQDKLPRNQKQLDKLLSKVKQKISFYKSVFFQEQKEIQSFF